jgi:type II secretory pathway pseudopilin PulG
MRSCRRRGSQHGMALIAFLVVLALSGAALATAGTVWHVAQQREKERELLFIGEQFRRAIMQYYEKSPGGKRYPPSLEVLVKDDRYPGAQRYLRRIYADPMTGKAEWGLVAAPGGGVMGIYSKSEKAPFKTANFPVVLADLEKKAKYSDWKFMYVPQAAGIKPASGIAPGVRQ